MIQVRHKPCGIRLFDSKFEVESISGTSPDVSIKCPRCSREHKHLVLAQYRFKLPRRDAPIPPEPVRCTNLNCMAILMDLSLPYVLVDAPAHITILCKKCKELNWIRLLGVIEVE